MSTIDEVRAGFLDVLRQKLQAGIAYLSANTTEQPTDWSTWTITCHVYEDETVHKQARWGIYGWFDCERPNPDIRRDQFELGASADCLIQALNNEGITVDRHGGISIPNLLDDIKKDMETLIKEFQHASV